MRSLDWGIWGQVRRPDIIGGYQGGTRGLHPSVGAAAGTLMKEDLISRPQVD